MKYRVEVQCHQGYVRDTMEDSAYPYCGFRGVLVPPTVVAVADGVGGLPGGEVASSIATHHMEEVSSEKELLDALLRAHLDIQSTFPGSATTLTAALLEKDYVSVYWVGDSPAFAIYEDGEIHVITRPHIQMGTGFVTRVLGIGELAADKAVLSLDGLFALVLATDGLTAHLSFPEIAEILREDGSVYSLLDEVLARGASDNVAVATIYPLPVDV